MPVDHRGLSAFLKIARLGSVGAAASALSLTQPAVSRTLRRLEQELGVILFVRHSTGMELTAFGRSLLPHAALLENNLHRALEEIDLLRGASKGVVRVGILPSLAAEYLPVVLKGVLQNLPGVQLQIIEAPTHLIISTLLRGEVDFVVAAVPPTLAEENVLVNILVEDEVCIVARTGHPIFKKKSITPRDFLDYNWALQEKGGVIWRDFRSIFTRSDLDQPNVVLTANSIQTLKAVLISSELLTLLPRIAIRVEEKNKTLQPIPLRQGQWRRQLAILRRSTGPILPAANRVMSEFQKALTQASAISNGCEAETTFIHRHTK